MHTDIHVFLLTLSDTREPRTDASGELLSKLVRESGWRSVGSSIVEDDPDAIADRLREIVSRDDVNLVLTTGGTGLSPRDRTPEATRVIIEYEIPGIPEAMRRETAESAPMAMLSRAVAGVAGGTLIVNLPGSPKAVAECFEVIRPVLQHAIDQIAGHTKH